MNSNSARFMQLLSMAALLNFWESISASGFILVSSFYVFHLWRFPEEQIGITGGRFQRSTAFTVTEQKWVPGYLLCLQTDLAFKHSLCNNLHLLISILVDESLKFFPVSEPYRDLI